MGYGNPKSKMRSFVEEARSCHGDCSPASHHLSSKSAKFYLSVQSRATERGSSGPSFFPTWVLESVWAGTPDVSNHTKVTLDSDGDSYMRA